MLIYPQLAGGTLSQFPVARRRHFRTIVNAAVDGSSVKFGDAGGGSVEWELSYNGLSDGEIAALQRFFVATEGSLNGFTFLDPTANLLSESELLTASAWSADPFLGRQGGVDDPMGGSTGWHLTNSGGGPQHLSQTIQAPGSYTYCFSVYVRSAQGAGVTLTAGNALATRATGSRWTRIVAVGSGNADSAAVAFGIELPAGEAVDVFGPQVETQFMPSKYRASTIGGVYSNARFRDDTFSFRTDGVNRHSTTVKIYYANHL